MTSTVGDSPTGARTPTEVPSGPSTNSGSDSRAAEATSSRDGTVLAPEPRHPSESHDAVPVPEPQDVLRVPGAATNSVDALRDGASGGESATTANGATVARAARDTALAGDEAERPVLGMRRGDRLVLAGLVAVGLALSVVHWVRLTRWGLEPVEIDRLESRPLDWRIDVNTAEWIDLVQLEGVGEVLAQRIVDDRAERGPFESVDELRRVKGIGEKTLEKLRPWLVVVPPDESPQDEGPSQSPAEPR